MADDGDMRSEHYRELLSDYVVVSADLGRLLPAAPMLVEKFCRAAELRPGCADWGQTGFDIVSAILGVPTVDAKSAPMLTLAVQKLCEAVTNHGPIRALVLSISVLLDSTLQRAPLRSVQEEVFLLAAEHCKAGLLPPQVLADWCVRCSRQARENAADYGVAQQWIQRADAYSVADTPELTTEREETTKLTTAKGAERLPRRADKQEPAADAIGTGEQGHFHVKKIENWVDRLQRLYPWVQAVRRVRADPHIPKFPTRVLAPDDLGRHLKGLPELDAARVIPIALDANFVVGERAVRMNIVLPAGTTASERDVAWALLRKNTSIFPEA
jgi:hypothetical protein